MHYFFQFSLNMTILPYDWTVFTVIFILIISHLKLQVQKGSMLSLIVLYGIQPEIDYKSKVCQILAPD